MTAVGAGSTTITATSEGQAGTSSITVTLAPVTTLALSTATTPMLVGGTQVLTATPKDANGNNLSGRIVNWNSSNTAVLGTSAATSVKVMSCAHTSARLLGAYSASASGG